MNFPRKIYYWLSPSLRLLVRRLFYLPQDIWNDVFHKSEMITPPKGMIFTGSGDFISAGNHYLNILIKECGFLPEHSVLDIGCGIGRLAIPLSRYLNSSGEYYGFDIVKSGIEWSQKNIGSRYPNFHFYHVPLKNDLYSIESRNKPSNFSFPYSDSLFDVVIATSVFTHMMPEDMEHYLKEVDRVLKPGGYCLFTFFLLNETSSENMENNSLFRFKYNYGHYRLMDQKVKEANVAFQENYIFDLVRTKNWKIKKLHYGFWSHGIKNENTEFQDLVILSKQTIL